MKKTIFQVFIENLVLTLLTLIKIVLFSKYIRKPKKSDSGSSECVILANGPSLNKTINENKAFLSGKSLFAVNFFVQSDFYQELKPEYYIINAPEFWLEDVEEIYKKKREELFKNLAAKTNHKLILFNNIQAKKVTYWQKILSENSNIQIRYFNSTPTEGFKFFINKIFSARLGMPRAHNILIPALMLAMDLEFNTIWVAGADHDWLKDIFVDDNNKVLLTQRHFYDGNEVEAKTMKILGKGDRKLHEVLHKFSISLESYFTILEYSKKKKISIYNITPNSFIDAFEKRKIS